MQEADAAAMPPQPGLVVQEADAAAMPQCTLSHKAQHPVQLSLQAGDPARPEEVVGDSSGSEMEEEPAGKRVRTCALPLRSNAPCCRDSFMTPAAASARALHQHGMLPVATPRRRQHRFSRAMRGPLMCYQQSLTPMASSLRSCTDMWHAVIESQHWGPLPAESHAHGSSFGLLHCIVARCHQKSAQGSGVALRRSDAPAARV